MQGAVAYRSYWQGNFSLSAATISELAAYHGREALRIASIISATEYLSNEVPLLQTPSHQNRLLGGAPDRLHCLQSLGSPWR
jgi:hypothetical protein